MPPGAVPDQAVAPLAESAGLLEKLVQRAGNSAKTLAAWMDPGETGNQSHTATLNSVLSEVLRKDYDRSFVAPDDARQYYKDRFDIFIQAVEGAGKQWAKSALLRQANDIGRLRFAVTYLAQVLQMAAREVVEAVRNGYVMRPMTAEASSEVVEGKGGKKREGIEDRIWRQTYMQAVRFGPHPRTEAARTGGASQAELDELELPFSYLFKLLAHPRGVGVLEAFANHGVEAGRKAAFDVLDECDAAIRDSLDAFAEGGLLWRCPPAMIGGLTQLGLARPDLIEFTLAWASRPSKIDNALEAASNALFLLAFIPVVGGIAGVLGEVVSLIGPAVALLREAEQDQLAEATTFAPPEEVLSEGSRGVPKIVGGFLTNLALQHLVGLALKGVVRIAVASVERNTLKAATAMAEEPPSQPPPRVNREYRPDPKMVNGKGLEGKGIGPETRATATEQTSTPSRPAQTKTVPEGPQLTDLRQPKKPKPTEKDVPDDALDRASKRPTAQGVGPETRATTPEQTSTSSPPAQTKTVPERPRVKDLRQPKKPKPSVKDAPDDALDPASKRPMAPEVKRARGTNPPPAGKPRKKARQTATAMAETAHSEPSAKTSSGETSGVRSSGGAAGTPKPRTPESGAPERPMSKAAARARLKEHQDSGRLDDLPFTDEGWKQFQRYAREDPVAALRDVEGWMDIHETLAEAGEQPPEPGSPVRNLGQRRLPRQPRQPNEIRPWEIAQEQAGSALETGLGPGWSSRPSENRRLAPGAEGDRLLSTIPDWHNRTIRNGRGGVGIAAEVKRWGLEGAGISTDGRVIGTPEPGLVEELLRAELQIATRRHNFASTTEHILIFNTVGQGVTNPQGVGTALRALVQEYGIVYDRVFVQNSPNTLTPIP